MNPLARVLLTFSVGLLIIGLVINNTETDALGAILTVVYGLACTSFAAAIIGNDQPPKHGPYDDGVTHPDGAQV